MKRLIFCLLILVTVEPCIQADNHLPPGIEKARRRTRDGLRRHQDAELKVAVDWFQQLTEWALSLRSRSVSFARHLQSVKKSGRPLDGADLDLLRRGTREHLDLRREIRHVISRYELWLPQEDDVPPALIHADSRIKGVMAALCGALVLYDNFAFSVMVYQEDSDLRRLINKADRGYGLKSNEMLRVLEEYNDSDNRDKVQRALDWLDDRKVIIDRLARKDRQMAWLQRLIEQSPSKDRLVEDGGFRGYLGLAMGFARSSIDSVIGAGEEASHKVSKVFGNTVGLVAVRDGKMYRKPAVRREVRGELKCLDILLEKTPFRLTDKLIPGHFGHVAVWIGSPEEIRELGLWDHELVKPHHRSIHGGMRIVEALRDGVQLSTMDHFLNVDDVAILRRRQLTREQKRECLLQAFRQLGKEYDFNFDVETTDRIVCSELIYHVFIHEKWPTEQTLGRATISPDNVAVRCLEKNPVFQLRALWHDGKRIRNPMAQYRKLLDDD